MELDMIDRIPPLDEAAQAAARARQDTLTKPRGSLGRLESLSIQLAGISADPLPRIAHKVIFGSDWPGMPHIGRNIEIIRGLPLADEAKEMILGGNAARILGLE